MQVLARSAKPKTVGHAEHVGNDGRAGNAGNAGNPGNPGNPGNAGHAGHDSRVTDPDGVQRMHYTAVLNALRCGLTACGLLTNLPGMHPADLLAAYVHLERLRMESWHAWQAIVEEPTVAGLAEHSGDASVLLPVPLYRIATVASNVHTDGVLRQTVAAVAAEIDAHARAAAGIEDMLAARRPPDAGGVKLGVKLHHPHEPALWGAPYFLPTRVTALSPMRVADLLGERPAQAGRVR